MAACAQNLPLPWVAGRVRHSIAKAGPLRADPARPSPADSETDTLTGLRNRRGWDRLIGSESHPSVACLIVVDLDGLEAFNDCHGHGAGDALIVRTALRLSEGLSPLDTVARIGGDQFAVLLPDADNARCAAIVAKLRQRLEIAEISASVGSASHHSQEEIARTLGRARASMFLEKQRRAERQRASLTWRM